MKDKNKYLHWIKRNKGVLSINSLERYIGLPALTLHHYHQTGNFPAAHLALLNTKMAKLLQHGTSPLVLYAVDRISLYRTRVKTALTIGGAPGSKELKARNEQLFDDIMELYLLVHRSEPLLADRIYKELSALKSPAVDEIAAGLKIGRLPSRAMLDDCRKTPASPETSNTLAATLQIDKEKQKFFPKEKK